MQETQPCEVPQLKTLLQPILKGNPLLVGGLEGKLPGMAVVDDLEAPTSCLLRMEFLGGTYFTCTDQAFLEGALTLARRRGEVRLIFEHPDVSDLIAPDGATEEWVNVTFTYRPKPDTPSPAIPDGCRLVPIDRELVKRCMWNDFEDLSNPVPEFHGSAFGYALMRDDEILCEAWAPFWAGGMVEIGIVTAEKHQRKGYATVACEHLTRECERLGWHPVWHTSREHKGSMGVARRLGFTGERVGPGYLYPAVDGTDGVRSET